MFPLVLGEMVIATNRHRSALWTREAECFLTRQLTASAPRDHRSVLISSSDFGEQPLWARSGVGQTLTIKTADIYPRMLGCFRPNANVNPA